MFEKSRLVLDIFYEFANFPEILTSGLQYRHCRLERLSFKKYVRYIGKTKRSLFSVLIGTF